MESSISVTTSLNARSFKTIPIDKYVPKVFGKGRTKFHLVELENRRRRECDCNGKKYLYNVSTLAIDERSSGTAQCALLHPKCGIYVSFQCHNTSPYSIYLALKQSPATRIDFQPCDLYSVMVGITKVLKPDENSKYPEYIEVPVWGGNEKVYITRLVDTDDLPLDPEEYVGIRISQVNPRLIKKHASYLGISEHLLPAPPLADKTIVISFIDVGAVIHLLVKANEAVQLQHEILAQHYATFQIASRKANENPAYTKEDYYWYVLEAFYTLEVKDENKLPAYFVLRLFIKDYLCESYSLYYNQFCTCNFCFSGGRYLRQLPDRV